AFLKNQGVVNATDVGVWFYYDKIDEEHLIGYKHYDSISRYQKYPSIYWDTKNLGEGEHILIVIADKPDEIRELDECNNEYTIPVYIIDTHPNLPDRRILITEVYPYTHIGVHNEFITITNPTFEDISISHWYLTTKPWMSKDKQNKIIFPAGTVIKANSSIIVTENATAYIKETSETPSFEYRVNSEETVKQMLSIKTFILPNNGGIIALKDPYNHTIDLIIYGEENKSIEGWIGKPIPSPPRGVILQRRNYNDTNTSHDWVIEKKIGQSSFPLKTFNCNASIQTFVSPDCSYSAITNCIRRAEESIYLNLYTFTNIYLCNELIEALKRNVNITILLDGDPMGGLSEEELMLLGRLQYYGAHISFLGEDDLLSRYSFNHGKYMIIDNHIVVIESCNWVENGVPRNPYYGNREWGIMIDNKTIASYYLQVFLEDFNPEMYDSFKYNNNFADIYLPLPEETYGNYKPCFKSKNYTGYLKVTPIISPDNSLEGITRLLSTAEKNIYVEQLYIYLSWTNDTINPFIQQLVEKARQGIDVRVIMNYNPYYKRISRRVLETKEYLEENDVEVKLIPFNWSYFYILHNKGVVVDNQTVLISSINWNKYSVLDNREIGVIIENPSVASYYADVFLYDWGLHMPKKEFHEESSEDSNQNTIYILSIFTLTFMVIIRDWRRRRWI
ncbi:MAG TPA: hypothetical protein ENG62_00060, partial [Thermoplasmatales archaeon]|nr:hypothetical protein [Thermoplasmatales archaeon]